ncbi:MAG: aspartate kinase [Oligoflexus sp.]
MYQLGDQRPVVQKYGGTSVGSTERIQHIAARVAKQFADGHRRIAIVVSAMSGETNRLVDLVTQVNPRANPRHYDMAVSAGEQVSVALMAAALEKEGVKSKGFLAYQLGILTDQFHAKARIQSIDCERLYKCWEEGIIPVIAGFQGVTKDHEITTLGRGGSDTSAVALAVALEASFCEINTDVDGVFTADPRVVPEARLSEVLDFEVALEMASLGSKVLHSRCVELAAKYSMPIVVRNTFQPNDHQRTKIMAFSAEQKLEAPVVSGVTLDRNVARITLDRLPAKMDTIAEVFRNIAEQGVNVDIIVHNKSEHRDCMRLGFTIGRPDLSRACEFLEQWKQNVDPNIVLETEVGLAKVSTVGLGMQSHPGVACRCFEILSRNQVEIHMISTSEIKISCVISEADAEKAAQELHKGFIEAE